jgi:hypothetical protein
MPSDVYPVRGRVPSPLERSCNRGQQHETSSDWRGGSCRARLLGARLGAKPRARGLWSKGIGRSQHPAVDATGGNDPFHRGAAGRGEYLGDAAAPPACARPPCDASQDGPWPEVGDGYGRTTEPSRARPPAGGKHADASLRHGAATARSCPGPPTAADRRRSRLQSTRAEAIGRVLAFRPNSRAVAMLPTTSSSSALGVTA